MSNYRMTLIVGGREINIPVLPAKLNVSSPGKNERVTVLDLGEVLLLRKKGLRILSWESFFPADSAPYTKRKRLRPIYQNPPGRLRPARRPGGDPGTNDSGESGSSLADGYSTRRPTGQNGRLFRYGYNEPAQIHAGNVRRKNEWQNSSPLSRTAEAKP